MSDDGGSNGGSDGGSDGSHHSNSSWSSNSSGVKFKTTKKSKIKTRYWCLASSLARCVLATSILICIDQKPESKIWLILIPWNVIAGCVAASIVYKTCLLNSSDGRSLSTKEGQNFATRIYIYWSVILGTLLWVIGLATHYDDIWHAYDNPWIILLCLPVFLAMDTVCIKPKNFKYAYKSYKKEAKDDDY